MATIKIKPSHPSQGDFVIIEEADFDPTKHQKYDEQKPTVPAEAPRRRSAKSE